MRLYGEWLCVTWFTRVGKGWDKWLVRVGTMSGTMLLKLLQALPVPAPSGVEDTRIRELIAAHNGLAHGMGIAFVATAAAVLSLTVCSVVMWRRLERARREIKRLKKLLRGQPAQNPNV
jgi:hypothetical protein